MLDAVGQAVIATDSQGRITYLNRAAERLYGWRADQALGRSILDVTVPQVSRAQAAMIMAELTQGREWSGEFLVQRRDGTTFPVEVYDTPILDQNGTLTGLIGVSSDITSRKKTEASLRELNENLEDLVNKRAQEYLRAREVAEAANEALTLTLLRLQESEARYRTVLEDQTELISRLTADGVYVFVNNVFCRFFGKTEAELLGQTWHPVVHADDVERVSKEIGMLSSSHPFVMIKNRVYASDGRVHWMEFSNRGVFDAAGSLVEIQSVGRDVTEGERTLNLLEKSFQQVQLLSERVMKAQHEERDRIAHELHDELGQTLTALKVRLQLLEPYCVQGEAEEHLNEALAITSGALKQIRGMALDLRPLGLEDLGLSAVLKSHLAKQADTARWDAHFESALTARLSPQLKMACFRVAQEALTNVMRHARAKEVWVTLAMTEGKVMLTVRDDGAGFDASGDPHFSSEGFGLIGMQERVRQMGGQLQIKSSAGRGTEVHATFRFEPDEGQPPDSRASARS